MEAVFIGHVLSPAAWSSRTKVPDGRFESATHVCLCDTSETHISNSSLQPPRGSVKYVCVCNGGLVGAAAGNTSINMLILLTCRYVLKKPPICDTFMQSHLPIWSDLHLMCMCHLYHSGLWLFYASLQYTLVIFQTDSLWKFSFSFLFISRRWNFL